jgi:hypothetical protein
MNYKIIFVPREFQVQINGKSYGLIEILIFLEFCWLAVQKIATIAWTFVVDCWVYYGNQLADFMGKCLGSVYLFLGI